MAEAKPAGAAAGAAEGEPDGLTTFGPNVGVDQPDVYKPFRVVIKRWHAVAIWKWKVNDECCGICRMPFDACCPDCNVPGDDCPPVWGKCNHAFHMHCIVKWIKSQENNRQHCPMCRRDWEFRA